MERTKESASRLLLLNDELFPPAFDSFTGVIAFNPEPQPPCHSITCDDIVDTYNASTPVTGNHHRTVTPSGVYDVWQTASIGALAAVISIVTVVGNITVILSFILERSIRQTTNYFIASLAVTDLLIGCISMPLYTVYLLSDQTWLLGETLCDLWLALDYTLCLCSIYTVFCITVDRYCSVTIPASYRKWRTERKVIVLVAVTWVFPVLVFFPSIIGWQYAVDEGRTVAGDKCYVQYMDSALFNCLLQVGYFWATLVVMCALYAGIYRVALRLHRRAEHRRRRTVSLMSVAGETLTNIGIGMTGAVGRRAKAAAATVPVLPAVREARLRIAAVSRSGRNGTEERPFPQGGGEENTEEGEEEEEEEDYSGSFTDSPKTVVTDCEGSTTTTTTPNSNWHREKSPQMATELNANPREVFKKYSLLTTTATTTATTDDVFVATEAKRDIVSPPKNFILRGNGHRDEIAAASAADDDDDDDDDFPAISEECRSVERETETPSLNPRAKPVAATTPRKSETQNKGDQFITAASGGRRRQISRRGPRFRWRLSSGSSTNDSPDLWPRPPKKDAQQVTGAGGRGQGGGVGEGGGRRKGKNDESNSSNPGCACVSREKSDSSCEKEDVDEVFYRDGTGSRPTANASKSRRCVSTENNPLRKATVHVARIRTDDGDGDDDTVGQRANDRTGSGHDHPAVASIVVCAIRRFARNASKSEPPASVAAVSTSTPFGLPRRPSVPTRNRSCSSSSVDRRRFRLPVTLRQFSSGKQQVVRSRPARDSTAVTSSSRRKTENHAKKSVRTITLILGAFVVCWTPWHVLSLIIGFCAPGLDCVPPLLYDISYWLCYLNSPLNPFCYAFANQHFKKTFVRILKFDWRRN